MERSRYGDLLRILESPTGKSVMVYPNFEELTDSRGQKTRYYEDVSEEFIQRMNSIGITVRIKRQYGITTYQGKRSHHMTTAEKENIRKMLKKKMRRA